MASDTNTDSLDFLTQGTGNNDNTWGALLNAQVIQYIEDALIGRTSKSTTGGATTLTKAECRPRFLDISGTLSSDATFTVPNKKNAWIITNSTAGSFAVLFKTASGTATVIPQGTSKEVYCDGSDNVLRMDRDKVGDFVEHAGTSAPAGTLECDGAAISRAGIGLDLFAKASTTWGVGNGSTTFNIPDTKTAGKFLRSRTGSVALGTAQSDQNKAHTHTGTTDAGGNHSHGGATASDGSHTHTGTAADHIHAGGDLFDATSTRAVSNTTSNLNVVDVVNSSGSGNTGGASGAIALSIDAGGSHTHVIAASGTHTHTFTTASDGGTEARPTNLSVLMCIRL